MAVSGYVDAACTGCGKPMRRLATASRAPWCKGCRPNRKCQICEDPHFKNGFCRQHYYRHRTYGDPLAEAQTSWSNRPHAVSRTAWELGRYGLTVERFQQMMEEQGGACGICGRALAERRLCIDHDHSCCPERQRSCGRCVRGLLCPRCNSNLEESWERRDVIASWVRRSLRSVVCFDLDSTLASTVHRRYLVPEIKAGMATWHDYALLCVKDTPIAGTVALARILWPSNLICIVSGRSNVAEDLTRAWLAQNAVPFDRLIMRSDDAENGDIKVNAVRQFQEEGLSVELFLEDWAPVAEHITDQTDVPVLGVNPFDPESYLITREQLAVVLDEVLSTTLVAGEIFSRLGGAF